MDHPNPPLAVDVIASGVHDAKNNMFDALARIGVVSQAIRAGQGDTALPVLAEAEQAIVAGTERLSKLLSAYRLTRHENPVSMLPVNVGDLIEDATLRIPATRRGDITLATHCAHEGLWVCDRELVTDCLVNALQNALRAARTTVRLGAGTSDAGLVFTVADDGPGFPAGLTTQGPTDRSGEAGQSGIGLFIARRIAHLHTRHGRHGHLSLENGGPLGGALFSLVLP